MKVFAAIGILIAATGCRGSHAGDPIVPEGATDPRVADQVAVLDEGDIQARESAMVRLIELGPDALPAIRNAARTSQIPEVCAQLQVVIQKLEEQDGLVRLMGRPRLVSISARAIPIERILAELTRQSGVPATIEGISGDLPADVDVRGAPVWKAVDDLCRRSGRVVPSWSTDRVTIKAGTYRETSSVEWNIGPIEMGRFWIECSQVEPKVVLKALLLVAPGSRYGRVDLFVDHASYAGKPLIEDKDGGRFLEMQACNVAHADGSILIPMEARLGRAPLSTPAPLRDLRGRVYYTVARDISPLVSVMNPTPGTLFQDPKSHVTLAIEEFKRTAGEVWIRSLATFPMLSDQYDRIDGRRGLRLISKAGQAYYPSQVSQVPLGGSMGASNWFTDSTFEMTSDVEIAAFQVLQPDRETNQMFHVDFDFPCVPVSGR